MANELYDVIDGNIIENGEKAITAQSLKNTLYALADEIGKGGQGGGEFYTLAIADLLGEEPLTEEQKAHNAELYRKIMEVDLTSAVSVPPVFCVGLPMMIDFTDGELAFILSIPAGMNADYTLMGYCLLIILNEDGSIIQQLLNA